MCCGGSEVVTRRSLIRLKEYEVDDEVELEVESGFDHRLPAGFAPTGRNSSADDVKMYETIDLYKMHTFALSEFRANTAAMIDLVERGETVRILRHGKPVAELVPVRADVCADLPSYKKPFEPLLQLPPGYSAVQALLDERENARY